MKRICIIAIVVLLSLYHVKAQGPCSYTSSTGKYYDLSSLTHNIIAGDWVVNTNDGTIYFNFCAPTRQPCSYPNQAVCDYTGILLSSSLSYGISNNYTFNAISGTTDGVQLVYPNSLNPCVHGGYLSSVINVYCSRYEEGRVSAANIIGCVLSIDFHSVHGCSTSISYPSPSPVPSSTPKPTKTALPPSSPQYPLIPGAQDQIGHGYNAFAASDADASLSAPIFTGYTYYRGSTWNSTEEYSVPDQIHIVRGQNFGVKSNVYKSVSDLSSEESWSSGAELGFATPIEAIRIPVRIGVNLTDINAEMEAKEGVLAIAKERIPLYSLRLYPQQTYDPSFISAVENLPTSFDPNNAASLSKFQTFLQDYGTHLQIGIEMGGEFGIYAIYDESTRREFNDVDLSISIKISFLHYKVGVSSQPFAGINKVPICNSATNTNTNYWIYGGTPPQQSAVIQDPPIPWYKNWVQSVTKNPAPIGRQLQSLHTPMATINLSAADAYLEYLDYLLQKASDAYQAPPQTVLLYHKPTSNYVPVNNHNFPMVGYASFSDECLNQIWTIISNDLAAGALYSPVSVLDWEFSQTIGYTPEHPH